jgi:hypothetical protein
MDFKNIFSNVSGLLKEGSEKVWATTAASVVGLYILKKTIEGDGKTIVKLSDASGLFPNLQKTSFNQEIASTRSKLISNLRYDLKLCLDEGKSEEKCDFLVKFLGYVRIEFDMNDPKEELFLDFQGKKDK